MAKRGKKAITPLVQVEECSLGERQIIRLYMQQCTPRAIATALRIDIKTVERTLDSPEVQAYVHAERLAMLDTFAQVEEEMTQGALESVRRMRKIVKDGKDKDAINAGKALMVLHPQGRFQPRQRVDHSIDHIGNNMITANSLALIESRLNALDRKQFPILQQIDVTATEIEEKSVDSE